MVESNRDIITLNKELPQIEAPFEGPSEKGITYADIDNRFDRDDKIILKNYGLPKPSELMSPPEDKLQIIRETSKAHEKEISPKLGGLKRRKEKTQEIKNAIESYVREKKNLINLCKPN